MSPTTPRVILKSVEMGVFVSVLRIFTREFSGSTLTGRNSRVRHEYTAHKKFPDTQTRGLVFLNSVVWGLPIPSDDSARESGVVSAAEDLRRLPSPSFWECVSWCGVHTTCQRDRVEGKETSGGTKKRYTETTVVRFVLQEFGSVVLSLTSSLRVGRNFTPSCSTLPEGLHWSDLPPYTPTPSEKRSCTSLRVNLQEKKEFYFYHMYIPHDTLQNYVYV